MPTFFVFNKLEDGYDWYDFEVGNEDTCYEYVEETLDVPCESIQSIEYQQPNRIEVTLIADRSFATEDWYHALLPNAA